MNVKSTPWTDRSITLKSSFRALRLLLALPIVSLNFGHAAEIILDNTSSTGVTITGAWTASTSSPGYYGSNYVHDGNTAKGSKSIRFTPTIPTSGRYDVYLRWIDGPTRASNVPVDVVSASGTERLEMDQRTSGGAWVLLGTYTFNAGTSGYLLISTTGTNGYVIADAVRLVPSGEIILDNGGPGVTTTGSWTTSSSAPSSSSGWGPAYYGANYFHDGNTGKGTKSVQFTPDIPVTKSYSVHIKWNSSTNRATNVPMTVNHAGGSAQVIIDQRTTGSGEWYYLGTYTFNAGTSGNVVVSNAGTDGYVIADAVRFAPLLDLSGYTMTFSEEFDDPLSVSNYGPGTRWIAHTPYNGDFGDAWFGYNPSSNVNPYSISSGILSVKAWFDATSNHWRSGLLSSVDTQGNGFSQQYGYFEARMKLPSGTGTWPAFWLLSKGNLETPKTKVAELDAMEVYGSQSNKVYLSTHIWNTDGSPATESFAVNFVNSGLTTGYHTYGLMVEPDVITWYVDGIQQRQVPTFAEAKNPLYILVNYALGGGWGTSGVGNPSYLNVDYVRAYSR